MVCIYNHSASLSLSQSITRIARDHFFGMASEKTNARLRLAFFVSLFPLFQTSFESRSFQNKNAPFGALFFLAEREDCEPNSPMYFNAII